MNSKSRVALAQLAGLPVGVCAAVALLWGGTHSTHGDSGPIAVVRTLTGQALAGDEELLVLLSAFLVAMAVAYAIGAHALGGGSGASLLVLLVTAIATGCCAGLESTWHPHRVLGNVLTALACTVVFSLMYVRAVRQLVRVIDEAAATGAMAT